MHLEIACGNESWTMCLESSRLRFLPLEARVQSLFSIEEPIIFLYIDQDCDIIIAANDDDLLNMQDLVEKSNIKMVLRAKERNTFLKGLTSPTLVKSVLMKYLSNFQQNREQADALEFEPALNSVDQLLSEMRFTRREIDEFTSTIRATVAVTECESENQENGSMVEDEFNFQQGEIFEFVLRENSTVFPEEFSIKEDKIEEKNEDQNGADLFELSEIMDLLENDKKEVDTQTNTGSFMTVKKVHGSRMSHASFVDRDLKNDSFAHINTQNFMIFEASIQNDRSVDISCRERLHNEKSTLSVAKRKKDCIDK